MGAWLPFTSNGGKDLMKKNMKHRTTDEKNEKDGQDLHSQSNHLYY